MRNVILNRNRTTWENTDTRLATKAFFEPTVSHQIDIREMGRGNAFNDVTDRLGNMGELKRDKGMADSIFGILIVNRRAEIRQEIQKFQVH